MSLRSAFNMEKASMTNLKEAQREVDLTLHNELETLYKPFPWLKPETLQLYTEEDEEKLPSGRETPLNRGNILQKTENEAGRVLDRISGSMGKRITSPKQEDRECRATSSRRSVCSFTWSRHSAPCSTDPTS